MRTKDRDVAFQRGRDAVRVMPAHRICVECGRAFNLADDGDAEEWAYGHDCES